MIEKSKLVFVAVFMLMERFDGDECAKFLKKFKEMGKTTALDTAWDSTGRWMMVMASSLPYLDYFLPSFEEAVELSGETDPEEMADVFLAMGPKVVVIKLGKDGCFIKAQDGEKYLIPTYDKIKPVDTTGAGDSFCAGFLTAVIKEKSLYECGQFGNAVGTHSVTAQGASTGIKCEAEILEFMKKYQKDNM